MLQISNYQMKVEILSEIRANKLPNPINSQDDRIIKIINNHDFESFVKQLNNRMRADETSTAGDQNRLSGQHHYQFFRLKRKVLETETQLRLAIEKWDWEEREKGFIYTEVRETVV